SAGSSPEDVAENWNINARGFDPSATLALPTDVLAFRDTLGKSRAFTARLDGVGISAGMYTDIIDGVTELVGIATLHESRRRGIGGALTAFVTQTAFADGASLAFLSAANEEAGRVYRRVGYQSVGNLLTLVKKT
ncbi:MAG: GNAT family N-acetyltransferase, partial [Chloroflexi bacterium]|nr:GNAT family N-acetyltransferase [Chloroflexota bacterium]